MCVGQQQNCGGSQPVEHMHGFYMHIHAQLSLCTWESRVPDHAERAICTFKCMHIDARWVFL